MFWYIQFENKLSVARMDGIKLMGYVQSLENIILNMQPEEFLFVAYFTMLSPPQIIQDN
jgi:hypothetical protein